jgi:putative ubiquitin-RnfH superfamily antitoxin RatB of RatAB toxin-antitoxin module
MTEQAPGPQLRVQLVRAWPGESDWLELELPAGACVADALGHARASGWLADAAQTRAIAIFGTLAVPATALHDGDRIELLRPLVADPKQGRRARAAATRPR